MDIVFRQLTPELTVAVKAEAEKLPWLRGHDTDYSAACVPNLSYAALIDGKPLVMGGLLPIWQGRAHAWMLRGPVPMRAWPRITRMVSHVFAYAENRLGYRRIEAIIDPEWGSSCAWATRLGFNAEGVLERYTPDDRDMIAVARIAPRMEERAAA